MNKIVLTAVSMIIGCSWLSAQPGNIPAIISEIAVNNKQLKAHQGYLESRDLSNRTMNNIEDLQLSGAYLPLGNHDTPHFAEFEVSQSFEFPSAYRTRSAYMQQDRMAQEASYLSDRQQVLADAAELCVQLIYQQKQKTLNRARTEKARRVYDQIEELYRKEEVGKLDLNKARIAWLQQQFSIEQIDAEINKLNSELMGLNGGFPMDFSDTEYWGDLALHSLDSLWQEKLAKDPQLIFREENEKAAEAYVQVQKKERLPEFGIGLNYEGVRGENYAGFSGGLSIPIWNKRANVRAAEARYHYETQQTDAVATSMKAEYSSDYDRYVFLLSKFNTYQSSLDQLDSEELLQKAYELGQLSYMEYYLELSFYQEAYDEMLAMERDLHLLRNQLLKHKF